MKLVLLISGVVLLFFRVEALELKVEQVKDNRAIVVLEPGMEIKAGDVLRLEQPSGVAQGELSLDRKPPAVVDATAAATTQTSSSSGVSVSQSPDLGVPALRKRQHGLSWRYDSGRTKTEINSITPTAVSSTSTEIKGEMAIGYVHNWGNFELGGSYAYEMSETEGSPSKANSGQLGVQFMVNFIENTPGHDVIPYVGLSLSGYSADFTSVDSTTLTNLRILGGASTIAVGLKWFPFGEILALDTSIYGTGLRADISGSGTGEVRLSRSGLNVGFLFYF